MSDSESDFDFMCSQISTKDFNASQSVGFGADVIDEDCQMLVI